MALKKPDAYLWKPSAIMNSPRVEELSALEELWYRRALDRSFDDEGIPADPARAATRIGRKCTAQAAAKILSIFFVPKPRDPSKMVNPVQEIARKNAIKALKKFSDAGKESGRKRREKKQENAQKSAVNVQQSSFAVENSTVRNSLETQGLTIEHRSNDVATINRLNKEELRKEKKEEIPLPPLPEIQEAKPDVIPETSPKGPFLEIHAGTIIAGVLKEFKLKKLNGSDHRLWEQQANLAFENGFTADQFLECLALLRKQHWRTSAVKPKHVFDNLPELGKLRKESKNQNGTNRNTNQQNQRNDADIIRDGIDFIANKYAN